MFNYILNNFFDYWLPNVLFLTLQAIQNQDIYTPYGLSAKYLWNDLKPDVRLNQYQDSQLWEIPSLIKYTFVVLLFLYVTPTRTYFGCAYRLHVGNPTYNSTHSMMASPIPPYHYKNSSGDEIANVNFFTTSHM